MDILADDERASGVSMQIVRQCLVLSVQVDLYTATLEQLQVDFLEKIRRSGVRRAIIDLSAVEVMDTHAFDALCDSAEMAKVMGANTVIAGIGPGVASALVGLGAVTGRINTCLNLEDAFQRLSEPETGHGGNSLFPVALGVSSDTAANEGHPAAPTESTAL